MTSTFSQTRVLGGRIRRRSLKHVLSGGIFALGFCAVIHVQSAQAETSIDKLVQSFSRTETLNLPLVDKVYGEFILEGRDLEETIEPFQTIIQSSLTSKTEKANAWKTIAHMQWKYGSVEDTLNSVDSSLKLSENADGLLLKARLLDATGKAREAIKWYQRAAAKTLSQADKEFIRIRLTMINVDDKNVAALEKLAASRDQAFKNRAAIALALLGRPDRATRLFKVDPEQGKLFQQHVRLAEWAIMSQDYALAQAESWQAYVTASARADKLYALSVLAEGYRKNDDLNTLLEKLTLLDNLTEELNRLRIDILDETGQYNKAISIYKNSNSGPTSAEVRVRLIKLYEVAGRPDDMVAEYRSLIDTDPKTVQWYIGLASHYQNIAKPDQALAVWQLLERNNQDNVFALLEGGQVMVQMGFMDEAISMIDQYMSRTLEDIAPLMFLFETYFRNGQDEEATRILERLEKIIPANASEIRDIADGYERLNKPEKALKIYKTLEESQDGLGYDEKLRLAWLYNVVGQKQESLNTWKEIWNEQNSAARRNLAEQSIMLLAAELNQLADIAIALEEKLIDNTITQNEMHLLTQIYTGVRDVTSAEEVIADYAKYSNLGEKEKLDKFAQVYLVLNDYKAYDKTMRSLYELDQDNRFEYIQNIILNLLSNDLAENASHRFSEIQRWLKELREFAVDAVSGEFEAGILSMGGFNDRAIESYRRALAENPENSDNLLLMAELMKSTGHRDKAVTMLQYVAEHAKDDNTFVVAIDGIINMIGARSFGSSLQDDHRLVFEWAHRIILERITGRADKFYLYQLLSNIAQELRDKEGEFIAIENSLSQAGIRRISILRELVTLSSANSGFGGFNTGSGDIERKLTYGRRLIGLQMELPPDVFIDLGKTLLKEGDTVAASRSLDMINDITGLIDIDKTKAELFEKADYPDQALAYYNRALSVNRSDLDLLAKIGLIREITGEDDVANRLYFRALKVLLIGQPSILKNAEAQSGAAQTPFSEAIDTGVNRNYRKYFETLAQGYLISLTPDSSAYDEHQKELRTLVDAELQRIFQVENQSDLLSLKSYSRLNHLAKFMRRSARRGDHVEEIAKIDLALFDKFKTDQAALAEVIGFYRDWGQEEFAERLETMAAEQPAARTTGAYTLFEKELEKAKSDNNFELLVRLTKIEGNSSVLRNVLSERIKNGKLRDGLAYARSVLEPVEFEGFLNGSVTTLKQHKLSLFDLYDMDAGFVKSLEEILGASILTREELRQLRNDPEVKKAQEKRRFFPDSGIWNYVESNYDLEEKIAYLEEQVENIPNVDFLYSSQVPKVSRSILKSRLGSAQKQRVFAALEKYIGIIDYKNQFMVDAPLQIFFDNTVPGDNIDVLIQAAKSWQGKSGLKADIPGYLEALRNGNISKALDIFITIQASGSGINLNNLGFTGIDYISQFDQEFEKRVGKLQDDDRVNEKHADILYTLILPEQSRYNLASNPELLDRVANTAPVFARKFPESSNYALDTISAYLAKGQIPDFENSLSRYYKDNPDDSYTRAALYLHYVKSEQFNDALAIAQDGGADLSDNEILAALQTKAREDRRRNSFGSGEFIFLKFMENNEAFNFWGSQPPIFKYARKLQQDLVEENGIQSRRNLRAMWRSILNLSDNLQLSRLQRLPLYASISKLTSDNLNASIIWGRNQGTNSLVPKTLSDVLNLEDTIEGRPLIEEAMAFPANIDEIEKYLQSVTPDLQPILADLYILLAKAYQSNPELEAKRLGALTARLQKGTINNHDFTLWMLMSAGAGNTPSENVYQSFVKRANSVHSPGDLQFLAIARLHALMGKYEASAQNYLLLVSRQINHREFLSSEDQFRQQNLPRQARLFSLPEILDEIRQNLPQAQARELTATILKMARRADFRQEAEALYTVFLVGELDKTRQKTSLIEALKSIQPDVTNIPENPTIWEIKKTAYLIRAHLLDGDTEKGLSLLRKVFERISATKTGDKGPAPANQLTYNASRIIQNLAGLYAIDIAESNSFPGTYDHSRTEELIANHNVIFPSSNSTSTWSDTGTWLKDSVTGMIAMLDEDNLDRAAVTEMLMIAIHSLSTYHKQSAVVSFEKVARKFARKSDISGKTLHNLSIMAVNLDSALPELLANKALNLAALSASQKSILLRNMADREGMGKALKTGKASLSASSQLPVLLEMKSIAEQAGDRKFASELGRRINVEQQAKQKLNLGD